MMLVVSRQDCTVYAWKSIPYLVFSTTFSSQLSPGWLADSPAGEYVLFFSSIKNVMALLVVIP